ncbi:formimidoylglutamase [soil metagenome]
MTTFTRPPADDDPLWPRGSAWLADGSADPELAVVGVPCSVGSISPSNADQTPPAVREALARLSPWDADAGVDLAGLPVADGGDWDVADLPLEEAIAAIRGHAESLPHMTADGRMRVHAFLGGDNAITRPLLTGLLGSDLERVGLLTLDAHHDVRHLEDGPRNGTPVRGLLADGLPGHNVIQLGLGAFTNSMAYTSWAADHGISALTADEVRARGTAVAVGQALATLAGHCEVIYVDLDIDVLDVAFAPACPGARPGGLAPSDLLTAARLAGAHPKVAAADLVEVDVTADHDGRTVMVTAMALLAFAAGVATRGRER